MGQDKNSLIAEQEVEKERNKAKQIKIKQAMQRQ